MLHITKNLLNFLLQGFSQHHFKPYVLDMSSFSKFLKICFFNILIKSVKLSLNPLLALVFFGSPPTRLAIITRYTAALSTLEQGFIDFQTFSHCLERMPWSIITVSI